MLCMGLLGAALARADSVTWIDQTSTGNHSDRTLNGHIKTVSGGNLSFEALFASGPKMYPIPMNQVRRMEFTNVFFNPGAPPTVSAFGERPPRASTTGPERPLISDAIELRGSGGNLQACKVQSIDQTTVHCEPEGNGKPKDYPRQLILRILVRGDE